MGSVSIIYKTFPVLQHIYKWAKETSGTLLSYQDGIFFLVGQTHNRPKSPYWHFVLPSPRVCMELPCQVQKKQQFILNSHFPSLQLSP